MILHYTTLGPWSFILYMINLPSPGIVLFKKKGGVHCVWVGSRKYWFNEISISSFLTNSRNFKCLPVIASLQFSLYILPLCNPTNYNDSLQLRLSFDHHQFQLFDQKQVISKNKRTISFNPFDIMSALLCDQHHSFHISLCELQQLSFLHPKYNLRYWLVWKTGTKDDKVLYFFLCKKRI